MNPHVQIIYGIFLPILVVGALFTAKGIFHFWRKMTGNYKEISIEMLLTALFVISIYLSLDLYYLRKIQ